MKQSQPSKRCNGTSAKTGISSLNDNNIGPGAKVKITRSGDVIPYVFAVVEQTTAQLPPGDWHWNETGVDIIVAGKDDHDDVKFQQLLDFFNTIDVDNLGEGNLRPMFDAGFKTPESIIELTIQDVQSLVGSRPIGKKIFDALHKKLSSLPEYVLMGAFPGFGRGIGVRKMKKLWEAFAGDMQQCCNIVRILTVDGFEQKTAQKISQGYGKYTEFLQKISKFVSFVPYEAPKQGHLTGQTIVFTGFRDKQLEQTITNAGGKIGTSVSSKTTILITADADSQSGKAVKAREIGINVVGKEQFIKEFL
jgi:NAD-dependent DNA ligase